MRYVNINNVSFTRLNGDSVLIKDFREYPAYIKRLSYSVKANDMIDEIITRKDLLGDSAESESYKIVDFNITRLFEADWNLGSLRSIDIPDMV
jgi:hypothetical protein